MRPSPSTSGDRRGAQSVSLDGRGCFAVGALVNSAYPPSTMTPVMRCRGHRFSFPSRQNSHSPHVHYTHGTPTRAPTWTLWTAAPRSTMLPTISCPRIRGFFTMRANCVQSPSATCRSEWHTPQTSTSIKTSSAPISGRTTECPLSQGPQKCEGNYNKIGTNVK